MIQLPEALLNGVLGGGGGLSGHAEGVMAFVEEVERLLVLVTKIIDTITYLDRTGGQVPIGDFILVGDTRNSLPPKRGVTQERGFVQSGDMSGVARMMDKLDFVQTKGGFSFPLLDDPKMIMKMILGQDIPLIQYQSPTLDVDIAFNFGLPVPGINVMFSGWFKFHAGIISYHIIMQTQLSSANQHTPCPCYVLCCNDAWLL